MLRAAARFLGVWFLAACLVVAVIDGAKSLAASKVVVTDVAGALDMLASILPKPGAADPTMQGEVAPQPAAQETFGPAEILRASPAAPLLALAGVLFLIIGRRRRRHPLGREYLA